MCATSPRSHALRRGRHSDAGRPYFVTTRTSERKPLFSNLALGRIVIDEIRRSDRAGVTHSYAFVVMPDHLHWLFALGNDDGLAGVVRTIKGRSARRVNTRAQRRGAVWQDGFHDRAVRRSESLRQIGDYILHNPVRAGLVARFSDYPLLFGCWYAQVGVPLR